MAVGNQETFAGLMGCSKYKFGLSVFPPLKTNIAGLQALLSNEKYAGLPPENIFTCEPASIFADDDIPAFCNDEPEVQDNNDLAEDEVSFRETEQFIKQYVNDCLLRTQYKQQNNLVPENPVRKKKKIKRVLLPVFFLVTFGALGATFIFKTKKEEDSPRTVASIPSKQTASNDSGQTQSLKRNNVKQNFLSTSAPEKDAGKISESLESTPFENFADDEKLKLFGISGTTASFQGRLCGYTVYGKVKLRGKTFIVISGNIKGQFSISGDSSMLTGNAFIESVAPCAFDLKRRNKEEINE